MDETCPLQTWLDDAFAAMFHSKKTALKNIGESDRLEISDAMLTYAIERHVMLCNTDRIDGEVALRGHVNHRNDLNVASWLFDRYVVEPKDIPLLSPYLSKLVEDMREPNPPVPTPERRFLCDVGVYRPLFLHGEQQELL